MITASKAIVEELRQQFPKGTRVVLDDMEDMQAPPVGTRGTVVGVDDTGSLLVHWDNGSSLNVLYMVDAVHKLKTVKTICYNEEEMWDSREDAMAYFLEAMCGSDGSERERYTNVYTSLAMGKAVCSDGYSVI